MCFIITLSLSQQPFCWCWCDCHTATHDDGDVVHLRREARVVREHREWATSQELEAALQGLLHEAVARLVGPEAPGSGGVVKFMPIQVQVKIIILFSKEPVMSQVKFLRLVLPLPPPQKTHQKHKKKSAPL